MWELFPDNFVLAEHLETLPAWLALAKTPEQWKVVSLLTLVSSFASYNAVQCTVKNEELLELL